MNTEKSVTLQFYFTLLKLGIIEYNYFTENSSAIIHRMVYLEAVGRFDKYID